MRNSLHKKCATELCERVCKNPNQVYCWEHYAIPITAERGRYRKKPKELQAFRDKIKLMYESGLSTPEIGRRVGKDHTTILFHLGKIGVKTRKPNPSPLIFKATERHDQFGRPLGRSYTELFENQYGRKPKKDFYD